MSHIQNLVILTRNHRQDALNKELDETLRKLIDRLQAEMES